MAGIPAYQFLHCNDQFEILIMQAVTEQVFKLMDERDDHLAERIANAVGKLFSNK